MIIQEIFSNLINMSVMASIVVLIVFLLRPLLKKAPRKLIYGLWVIVALRLVIPDMIPTDFSLFNAVNMFADSILHTDEANNTTNINETIYPDAENKSDIPTAAYSNESQSSTIVSSTENPTDTIVSSKASYFEVSVFNYAFKLPTWSITLWLIGMGVFLIYFIISYVLLSIKVRYATLVFDTDKNTKAYYCECISAPFVFGILRPRIYIPYGIKENNLDLILQHEQYHIRKGDHLTKIFAFFLLAVYWFCPFVWLAYYLSQKDMELRCDEAILKNASLEKRKHYSNALLAFAGNNRKYLLSPVAFSENNTKERIRLSLTARKVSVAATVIAVIAVIIVAIMCLTDDNNKDYNIPYGLYLSDNLDYISVKANGIAKSNMAISAADIYHDYTIEDNVIYVHTEDEATEIEIEIKNKSTIVLENKEYNLDHTYDEKDWFVANEDFSEIIEDTDTPSVNTSTLQYGFYETQDIMKMQLEITEDKVIDYGSPMMSRGPIEYEYIVKDNIIYATSKFNESLEIEIVNSLHLKWGNYVYTYDPDAGIEVDSYLIELTDEDINSAIEVAREYYESKFYIERIDSILLCENRNIWIESIKESHYIPGALIVLETECVWSGNYYASNRWMILYRNKETNNQWTILSEYK